MARLRLSRWLEAGLLVLVAAVVALPATSVLRATSASAPQPSVDAPTSNASPAGMVLPSGGVPAATSAAPAAPAPVDRAIVPPTEDLTLAAPSAPSPPVQAPLQAIVPATGGLYAVIIGIDDYPGSGSDLAFGREDADDMAAALTGLGVPAANLLVLRDGQATEGAILGATDWLAATAGPGTTAVFFYAGHVRKTGSTTESVVAADGAAIDDAVLGSRLARIGTRDVWIVMASCFGGGFTELLAPGRVLTAAADANSLAYENDLFGRSYLVEYIVRKGLIEGGAPRPTVQDAAAYGQSLLAGSYPDRVPVTIDQSDHAIYLDGRGGVAPPPPPAAPPPSTTQPPPSSSPPPASSPPPSTPPTTEPEDSCFLGLICIGG